MRMRGGWRYLGERAELGGWALERALLRFLVVPKGVEANGLPELRGGLNLRLGFHVVLEKQTAREYLGAESD